MLGITQVPRCGHRPAGRMCCSDSTLPGEGYRRAGSPACVLTRPSDEPERAPRPSTSVRHATASRSGPDHQRATRAATHPGPPQLLGPRADLEPAWVRPEPRDRGPDQQEVVDPERARVVDDDAELALGDRPDRERQDPQSASQTMPQSRARGGRTTMSGAGNHLSAVASAHRQPTQARPREVRRPDAHRAEERDVAGVERGCEGWRDDARRAARSRAGAAGTPTRRSRRRAGC